MYKKNSKFITNGYDALIFAKNNFDKIAWDDFASRDDFKDSFTISNPIIRDSIEHKDFKNLFDKYLYTDRNLPLINGINYDYMIKLLNNFTLVFNQ